MFGWLGSVKAVLVPSAGVAAKGLDMEANGGSHVCQRFLICIALADHDTIDAKGYAT